RQLWHLPVQREVLLHCQTTFCIECPGSYKLFWPSGCTTPLVVSLQKDVNPKWTSKARSLHNRNNAWSRGVSPTLRGLGMLQNEYILFGSM
ncbi:unnamed protein product, partial [Choristocarpus tenellus]